MLPPSPPLTLSRLQLAAQSLDPDTRPSSPSSSSSASSSASLLDPASVNPLAAYRGALSNGVNSGAGVAPFGVVSTRAWYAVSLSAAAAVPSSPAPAPAPATTTTTTGAASVGGAVVASPSTPSAGSASLSGALAYGADGADAVFRTRVAPAAVNVLSFRALLTANPPFVVCKPDITNDTHSPEGIPTV